MEQLARDGFYNNVPFHRVIAGFMARTGDGQNGNGTGGSKYPDLNAKFSKALYTRGTVGHRSRTSNPNWQSNQFFIMFASGAIPQWEIHRGGRSGPKAWMWSISFIRANHLQIPTRLSARKVASGYEMNGYDRGRENYGQRRSTALRVLIRTTR